MRTIALTIAALIALPAVARAQMSVDVHFGLPAVLPPLVVVSPGVQVVPEAEHEVFFTNGWYWARRDQVWYRSRVHTSGWMVVPERRVPPGLARIPPGKYRHWKAAHRGGGHGDGGSHGGHDHGGHGKGNGKGNGGHGKH